MKITVKTNELNIAINQAIFFLKTSNTYMSPILNNIKCYFTGQELLIQTITLEDNFSKSVSVKVIDPESYYFILDPKEILNVLNHIKTDTITITSKDTNEDIIIEYGNNNFEMAAHSESIKDAVNELPVLISGDNKSDEYNGVIQTLNCMLNTKFDDKSKLNIAYDFNIDLISKALIKSKSVIPEYKEFSYLNKLNNLLLLSSNDAVKPAYTGMNVRNINNKLAFEATDGKFLGQLKTNIDTDIKEPFILPKKIIQYFLKNNISKFNLKMISSFDKQDKLLFHKIMYITTEDCVIQIKAIEGTFPNADQVIPEEYYGKYDVRLITNNKEFNSVLDEMMNNKDGGLTVLRFNFNAAKSKIISKTVMLKQEIDISKLELDVFKDLEINFDKAKLKTLASNFNNMKIYFRTSSGPAVFSEDTKEFSLTGLLMPIRPQ
jgi:hypothetical protein